MRRGIMKRGRLWNAIVAVAVVGLCLSVLTVALHAQAKQPGGCDIPKEWGRVAAIYTEMASHILVLEDDSGAIRFLAWRNCRVIALAQRTQESDSRERR